MNLLRTLFGSKKFIAMLSGLIVLAGLKVFKINLDSQTVAEIVGLIAVYIGAQGIADSGKAAAQTSAIAGIATTQLGPAAQTKAIEEIKKV